MCSCVWLFCSTLCLGDIFLLYGAEVCLFLLLQYVYHNLVIHFTADSRVLCLVLGYYDENFCGYLCISLLENIGNHFSCVYSQEWNHWILRSSLFGFSRYYQTGFQSVRPRQRWVTLLVTLLPSQCLISSYVSFYILAIFVEVQC